jgi:hypothetical protein
MGDWVSEFPNDNPELFSQPPPAMNEADATTEEAPPVEEETAQFEVIDAFDEEDFVNATLESIAPAAPEPIVEEIAAVAVVAEAAPPPESKEEAVTDYWLTYVNALREVASSFGAPAAVVAGMALTLEADPVARMWRIAINGGEPDFSACAQTLDEWSAMVVARLADAQEQMVEPIRRALRSRGVCAFGLVVEAA